jgi:tetratricopeptide (TPR) repeat protein
MKLKTFHFFAFLLGFLFLSACSQRITPELQEKREKAVSQDTSTQVLKDSLSDCVKFDDIKKSEEALEAYVLYRDFFKLNQYDQALPYWRKVYRMAPAADGQRYVVFTDGVYLFEYLSREADNDEKKHQYVDTLLTLYDEAIECYPKYEGFLMARKAYDVYYKHPKTYTQEQKVNMFIHAGKLLEDELPYFVINPFTALLVESFQEGIIDTAETREWVDRLKGIVMTGIGENPNDKKWQIVDKYTENQFENLERIQGFYDCAYFKEKFSNSQSDENLYDCDNLLFVSGQLKRAGCPESDSLYTFINQYLKDSCRLIPGGASGLAKEGIELMKNGQYDEALDKFEEAIDFANSDNQRAQYALMQAKICYSYTRNFPKSREYARKAAQFREGWGEPYILIGKLYASSGPLCGPGRGWDSQIVVWPAIDKWKYARSIDPSVDAEAQSLINKYFEFMPTREDISKRLLEEGDDFSVGCWIQEKTTVRISRAY